VEKLESNAWELIQDARSVRSELIHVEPTKVFHSTSVEINQRVGAYVKERAHARVDLENAELTCWIEIVEQYALIYVERFAGPGGLPVGTSGKVIVLLSGGIDSPVAAWKMIKRGCTAVYVHFHSFPYTNKESQEKARQIVKLLCSYALRSKITWLAFGRNSKAHHGRHTTGDSSHSIQALHDADRRANWLVVRRHRVLVTGRQRWTGGVSNY
jgi:adenylyl- and sulfurtransferase ThiI